MTIAAAWIRTLPRGVEELLFCSDSRLTGGKRFDHCQKIFRFSGGDVAICFAGATDWAYPLIIATINAADIHFPIRSRAIGLAKFKTHVINIMNDMQRSVHNFSRNENVPKVTFILGGYDCFSKRFRIWHIRFDTNQNEFRARERKKRTKTDLLGRNDVAGDEEWTTEMRRRLSILLQSKYGNDKIVTEQAKFDMEPFEIIRDLLKNSTPDDSIGGAPQIVKIYQFLNSADVGIFWPTVDEGNLFLSGRPLLAYERATVTSIIDPSSCASTWYSGKLETARNQLLLAINKQRQRNNESDDDEMDIPD